MCMLVSDKNFDQASCSCEIMSQNLTGLVSGREDVRREERAANPWKLQVLLELKEYASGHRLILRLHSASTHAPAGA